MRYPGDQKAKTRQLILEAAGRVFRRRGYHGGGVDAVMKEAGLTHGGFYAHFRNKEALLAETVTESMAEARRRHDDWTRGREGAEWLRSFSDHYLSKAHLEHVEIGCPVPTLVSELDRTGDQAKVSFEAALRNWAGDIERQIDDDPESDREARALGVIAASVGGMAVARAVADPELAEKVLAGARELILEALTEESQGLPSPRRGGENSEEKRL